MGRKIVWLFMGLAFLGLFVVVALGAVGDTSRSPGSAPVTVPGADTTITVTLINQTTEVICGVYITPSREGEWGPNLLDREVVGPGEHREFPLLPGTYDFRVDNCFDYPLAQERIEVTDAFDWVVVSPGTAGGE